jgi:two-component system, response regulator YesN
VCSLQFEVCGEAENGEQALALIEQLTPELVIVDIRMPVLDGLELIRRVKTESEHQPLFIILSGYPDFSYAQQAFRYDVSDYILKPVDEHELTEHPNRWAPSRSIQKLLLLDDPLPAPSTREGRHRVYRVSYRSEGSKRGGIFHARGKRRHDLLFCLYESAGNHQQPI